MKKFIIIFGFAFFTLLFANQSFAQTTGATVKLWDDSEQQFTLTNAGKFYFQNGNIIIDEGNGNVNSIAVSSIRKITLQAGNSIENYSVAGSLLIYPNPTSDKLFFASEQLQNVNVAIYSMSGQLLQQVQTNTSESIDVSSLSKGIYIIKINEQTHKFSKL